MRSCFICRDILCSCKWCQFLEVCATCLISTYHRVTGRWLTQSQLSLFELDSIPTADTIGAILTAKARLANRDLIFLLPNGQQWLVRK